MGFRQYSLELAPRVVRSINDRLTTSTTDFDDMYPKQQTTFANLIEVDEALTNKQKKRTTLLFTRACKTCIVADIQNGYQ